jgi:hypothetical protein
MNGKVSKTQVRPVSCGLIPDQTQKTNTIISNIMGYLFDDMQYLLPDTSMFDRPNVSGHQSAVPLPARSTTWFGVLMMLFRLLPPARTLRGEHQRGHAQL